MYHNNAAWNENLLKYIYTFTATAHGTHFYLHFHLTRNQEVTVSSQLWLDIYALDNTTFWTLKVFLRVYPSYCHLTTFKKTGYDLDSINMPKNGVHQHLLSLGSIVWELLKWMMLGLPYLKWLNSRSNLKGCEKESKLKHLSKLDNHDLKEWPNNGRESWQHSTHSRKERKKETKSL